MFKVYESGGRPVIVDGNLDGDYTDDCDHPLYAVRLTNQDDLTSLDTWYLDIGELKSQKGGASILNNVIDSNKKETAVVELKTEKTGSVSIQVITLDGNIVKVLQRGVLTAGTYYFKWDGTNKSGNSVARGMYFVRVIGPGIDKTLKVMVVQE